MEICRLCLCCDDLRNIFNSTQFENHSTVLSLTTGLKIEPNDGLPQLICNKCTSLVNSALHLRNISQESDIKLRNTEKYYKNEEIQITENNCFKDNVILSEDGKNNDGLDFEVEIEFDRLTDDNGNGGNGDEAKASSDIHPQNKKEKDLARNEKGIKGKRKEKYLSLVDGVFNPKGPVKCKICQKTVSKWSCFISHAQLHLGLKFMCEFCGKSFITSTQLKRHCRSFHGMKRELRCKQCSYLALDNAQLLLHVRRVHTGERPYVCDICAASYFSRRCLVQHLESHRTVATVQCEECSQTFKSSRHLSRHRYAAHGPRRAECPHCCRGYSKKYLKAHISKHHSGQKDMI